MIKYYQAADIANFPKQSSLNYFDVQGTGLQVVLEINEINVERVENQKGLLFSMENMSEFRNAITTFGNMNVIEFERCKNNSRNNIVDNYNYEIVAQKFPDIMVSGN